MAGGLITKALEYQLGNLLMGQDTSFVVSNVQGLTLEGLRTNDSEDGARGGDFSGQDLISSRTIDFDLSIHDELGDELSDSVDLIAPYFNPLGPSDLVDFAFQFRNRPTMYIPVKPRRFAAVHDNHYHRGWGRYAVRLYAPIPYILEASSSSHNFTLSASGTTVQNTFSVGGTSFARPLIEIGGPCRNPRLEHVGQDLALRVDIDVQAGETLTFDTEDRRVLLDGVDTYQNVRADNEWWELMGGQSNTLIYSRSSTGLNGASSTVTLTWNNSRLAV